MTNQFEDNPPCVPSRSYRDVIDHANAVIAAVRARKWQLSIRYHVSYGYQAAHTQHFVEFAPALAFFVDHLDDGPGPFAPRLLGYAHSSSGDDYDTGLTESERDAVALAEQVFGG